MDGDDASELERLRVENAALRVRVERLEGIEAALRHLLDVATGAGGARRRRDPARLLGEPVAGSA